MTANRVSATLSADDVTEILKAINVIKTKLPFLVNLSSDEIKKMPNMGDRREFVEKALQIGRQNPDMLPRSFDVEEMSKDVELYKSLAPIMVAITQLNEFLDSTNKLVASEMYSAALVIYTHSKMSGKEFGLEELSGHLGKAFARKLHPVKSTPPETKSS